MRNEFAGLDPHRQYRNAFARLLKPDPLGRVLMMGTDQRDMFVPELRRAIETSVPSDGHIFDFGAGDGQTFALVADSVPQGTRVSIEEPNPEYLANYRAFLKQRRICGPVSRWLRNLMRSTQRPGARGKSYRQMAASTSASRCT